LSSQTKLIGVLVVALLVVLAGGFIGLQALQSANTDLKAELAGQMQPQVDLGTVKALVLENRALLLQAEVDHDSAAVPETLERINANETTVTGLTAAYAARATTQERAALDRFNADRALSRSAMLAVLEALRLKDNDSLRTLDESKARTHIATSLNDLAALIQLQHTEAGRYFQRAVARATFGVRLITASVIARILVAAALGLTLICAVRRSLQQARELARALAEERRKLSDIIEGTGASTWELDIASGTTVVSDQFALMTGHDAQQISALSSAQWRALIHPHDLPALEAAVAAAAAAPESVLVEEYRIKHAQGHWMWILSRGKVMSRDAQGRALRMAGLYRDTSARKMAEDALKDSETKFRSLFELSPVGIALTDLHSGQYLAVNDALVAPTGYLREELLSMSQRDLTRANGGAAVLARLQSVKNAGRYGPIETECVRKDGSTYAVLLSGILLTDTAGRRVVWSIVQDISRRKAMESELADAAWRDKLTGLPNRALFMARLQHAVERARYEKRSIFAVLFLDFDHFKLLNDTLGHKAGDELLKQMAQRLQGALKAADTISVYEPGNLVARMGGDEFLILVNDLKTPADASGIAERLLNTLAPVYQIFGSEVHSSASIGIVTSDLGGTSAEEIVRNADVAMYEAKHAGRACSVVFNEAMHVRLTRHATIETSLRRAVGTPELSLLYQPIIDLNTGCMVSVEALARWRHPILGAISPAEFIPIAEGSGLIVAIGEWVQRQACQAMLGWLRQDPQRAPKTVSVNISRAELALGPRLIERLRGTLRDVGLAAEHLQLEITEREVMRNPKASLEALHGLRDLGVKLAMDDFGTGTSSLAVLSEYPFDTIKVDRSFLKELSTSRHVLAVIHATVNLVSNLDMVCVAEGVEEPSQVAVLQSLGCHCAQGYLFSRPVTAEELLGALKSRADWHSELT
jgi:diguanylate cyclase (GGDEF)-like protein/PAS domain S-box-containing protein